MTPIEKHIVSVIRTFHTYGPVSVPWSPYKWGFTVLTSKLELLRILVQWDHPMKNPYSLLATAQTSSWCFTTVDFPQVTTSELWVLEYHVNFLPVTATYIFFTWSNTSKPSVYKLDCASMEKRFKSHTVTLWIKSVSIQQSWE